MVDPREIEFNLIDEPWIRVQSSDLSIKEVSLQEALISAHQFKDLAGESPTQNIAVLRVLLAVLHTVFERVDVNNTADPIKDADSALFRWEQIWNAKHIPENPIRDYLSSQYEKFFLFHPTNPFWQVPAANIGTFYSAAKLNGEMLESDNKSRLFLPRMNQTKEGLSYSEAARWLLHINGYDDTSAKPKGKGLPSPGAGYLGKIGPIIAKGNSLFETLVLNLVFLRDAVEVWEDNAPVWERPFPKYDERTEIVVPNNPAGLLTMQSRRLLLKRENGRVMGYFLLGGDFFNRTDAFSEQMTVWRPTEKKKDDPLTHYAPRQHDPTKQMWRDFSVFFTKSETQRQPGIVLWLEKIKAAGILPKNRMIQFSIAGAKYGDKDFFVTDVFSDSLSIHSGLFTELGLSWQMHIVNEISVCDSIAREIGKLADNISLASGDDSGTESMKAKEVFYARVDIPFRRWLRSLDPESDGADMETDTATWRKNVLAIAVTLGKELADAAGTKAYVGREITKKENNKEITRHYSAPEAFNWFCYNMKKYH